MNTIEQKNYTKQKHSFLHKKKKIIIRKKEVLYDLVINRWCNYRGDCRSNHK